MSGKCIIIGGGIIGMMSALELSNRGWDTVILEKSECGKESSWAGGGIVSPLYPWNEHPAVNDLAFIGQQLYPQLAKDIQTQTGIEPEWIPSGMLYLDSGTNSIAHTWLDEHKFQYELWDIERPQHGTGLFVPHIAQIRPPRLAQGLKQYLANKNIEIHEHTHITDIWLSNSCFGSVVADGQQFEGDCVIVAAGAWSTEFLSTYNISLDIKPIRGQIITFQTKPGSIPNMMMNESKYVIPRKDGLVLAGSTVEDAGFDKQTTEDAKQEIIQSVYKMCPELQSAEITHHWSGLRPGTGRKTPVISKVDGIEGMYINTGHFRCGLTLAPGSARHLANQIENSNSAQDVFTL